MKIPKGNRVLRNVSYGGRWLDLYDGMDFSIISLKDNLIADPDILKWLNLDEKTRKKVRKIGELEKIKNRKFVTVKYGDPEIMKELETNGNIFMEGDPGFVDLANGDFRLKEDSSAFKLGFKPIPFDKIGLYIDEYRSSLPE